MDFLGGDFKQLKRQLKELSAPGKRDRDVSDDYDMDSQGCVYLLEDTIPFGAGYIYVRAIPERDYVLDDVRLQTNLVIDSFMEMVNSLDWITSASKQAAATKSQNLVKNVGWPYWYNFNDTLGLDLYHQQYSSIATMTDFFSVLLALNAALQQTEVGIME